LESVDYGVMRDSDFFTDWVVQSAILETHSIPERQTCGKLEVSFPNIYLKTNIHLF
jgi:hypothetical protein